MTDARDEVADLSTYQKWCSATGQRPTEDGRLAWDAAWIQSRRAIDTPALRRMLNDAIVGGLSQGLNLGNRALDAQDAARDVLYNEAVRDQERLARGQIRFAADHFSTETPDFDQ